MLTHCELELAEPKAGSFPRTGGSLFGTGVAVRPFFPDICLETAWAARSASKLWLKADVAGSWHEVDELCFQLAVLDRAGELSRSADKPNLAQWRATTDKAIYAAYAEAIACLPPGHPFPPLGAAYEFARTALDVRYCRFINPRKRHHAQCNITRAQLGRFAVDPSGALPSLDWIAA